MEIRVHDGDRDVLRDLFRIADDAEAQIEAYYRLGTVLVAVDDGAIVGHVQQVATDEDGVVELKSLATLATHRKAGVGRALVAALVERCRAEGARRIVVSTATADAGVLRFYQRQGFRMLRIVRDAFGPHSGYLEPIVIDGVPLRDQVWLDREL